MADFIPYAVWIEQHPEHYEDMQTCEACGGTGKCVCAECSAEHVCGVCGGNGKVDAGLARYEAARFAAIMGGNYAMLPLADNNTKG